MGKGSRGVNVGWVHSLGGTGEPDTLLIKANFMLRIKSAPQGISIQCPKTTQQGTIGFLRCIAAGNYAGEGGKGSDLNEWGEGRNVGG